MMRLERRWLVGLLVGVQIAALAADDAAYREQVEADWARQDAARLAEIQSPGTIRFPGGDVIWPGLRRDDRLPVARGTLERATELPSGIPDGEPLRLSHDGETLYARASFPSHLDSAFRGDPTAMDAAGAVDGVKNGLYGFHVGWQAEPWWEVDLGEPRRIGRIVVYNRLDYAPGLHNADTMQILVSEDRVAWSLVHDHGGRHFGGVSGGGPLVVEWKGGSDDDSRKPPRARFVRLRIPSTEPIFFHLDEVEIYAVEDPERNVALHRPARQMSLSPWSRGGPRGGAVAAFDGVAATLDPDDPDGVLWSGLPPEVPASGRIAREGSTTRVELSVPLAAFPGGFPREATPPGGASVAIRAGASWTLSWSAQEPLGFGANRVAVEIESARPIDPPLRLTVETVVFTQAGMERAMAWDLSIDGASRVERSVPVLHEGAAAVLVTARQGATELRDGVTFFIEPVAEAIRRARLQAIEDEARRLADWEAREGPDPDSRRALYRRARWLAREAAFESPLRDLDEIVFVKRFTQEAYPDVCLNHMPWVSRPGGDICVLRWRGPSSAPEVRGVIAGRLGPGHVHGMDLHFDGERVVFGYARASGPEPPEGWLDRRTSFELRRNEEPIHIFEVRTDGSALRQLTDGEWSDLDPTYVPGGKIAFVSERCGYSLQCNEYDKDETSCNLYVMRDDGTDIRRLSVTKDGDYLPHALADGTIGYTRWEYQERGWAHIQSIWIVRPDGTGADAIFKQHLNDPWALEETRSIPGSSKLVAIATGHHTLPAGPLVIVDPRGGFNTPEGIRIVTPGILPPEGGMSGRAADAGGVRGAGGYFMTPWPLSERLFLVSRNYGQETEPNGYALYLAGVDGTLELIYRDPAISCFVPIPRKARPSPPVLPDLTDRELRYATCVVSDVARGVEGVPPESVRYLRVSQRLAWPYTNEHGGERYEPDVKGVMINWTPARVLGTVPVEKDGSAHFRVPIDTPIYFQLLDESFMELRRMRSFISFQPDEVRGCVGCHETRAEAPPARARFPEAARHPPVQLDVPSWGTRALSFLRDVQPVFDRHCGSCHGGLEPAGGLDFSGGLTARHNRAYDTILAHDLVSRSNVGDDARVTQPLEFGSHKSRLVLALGDEKHRERVRLQGDDWVRLVTWIDANAPYHDGFLNKRSEPRPYDLCADRGLSEKVAEVHDRRCGSCHEASSLARLDWIDVLDPGRSRFLLAPLGEAAGGEGACSRAVYATQDDPDYRALLDWVTAAAGEARARPRRDLRALAEKKGPGPFN